MARISPRGVTVDPLGRVRPGRPLVEPIGAAFVDMYRRDALKAKRSTVRLSLVPAFAILCIKGMPLHFLFHPWGQVALVLWVPLCGWPSMDCTIFITQWFGRRKGGRPGGR